MQVPESLCSHCLPDCVGVSYDAAVSAAPFRRCDIKNIAQTKTWRVHSVLFIRDTLEMLKSHRQSY